MTTGDDEKNLPARIDEDRSTRIIVPGSLPRAPDSDVATATRRSLLIKGALIGAAVTFVSSQWAPWLIDKGIALNDRLQRHADETARARDLFEELFGAPATLRHSHAGSHPDNLVVEKSLRRAFGIGGEERADPDGQMRRLGNLNEDLILFGGPNSTWLTMLAWEFTGENMKELHRDPEPCIPLRFFGISNEKDGSIPPYMIRYVNAAGENETDLPWPLVDTQDGMKPYLPKAGARIPADGQVKIYEPTEDNLIITRLPNFFASDSATHPSVWPQIVCLEGSNGIGTRAAELLVQPEGLEALQSLKKRLNGATAFQALFRAYGLEKTHDGIHRYRRIELREWSVTPLAVTPQHLQRAYATAMARLTAHGGGIQI